MNENVYNTLQATDASGVAAAAYDPMTSMFGLLLAIAVLAGLWKLFTKAGKPGWAAIVPIYNTLIMLEIAGKPWWWLLLMLVPLVNIVIAIMATHAFVQSYGKGTAWTVFALFLPFIAYPMMGFSKDVKYVGPAK